MATEVIQVENAEQPVAQPEEATAEKIETVTANGDHKLENGNGNCEQDVEASANGEVPNATSTPKKEKAKKRAIVANMRAAFQRLGLMSQLRALGRRMRRSPKQKQAANGNGNAAAESAAPEAEKPQENGNGAILDGAALLATTTPAPTEEQPAAPEPTCNGNGHAAHDENAAECESSANPVVEVAESNEQSEPTAVAAQ